MDYTVGIFLYNEKDNKILIVHPTNSSQKFWSIPKGLKEENEDAFITGVRELREETNISLNDIDVDIITYIEEFPTIKYPKRSKSLIPYLVMIKYDVNLFDLKCECMVEIDGIKPFPEIDEFKWVSIDEALPLIHVTQQKTLLKIKENLEL